MGVPVIDSGDHHPTALWNIIVAPTKQYKDVYVFLLEEMGAAVAWTHEPRNNLYEITATRAFRIDPLPTQDTLSQEFITWCQNFNVPVPSFTVVQLPEKNWLAENRASFPPLHLGRFFIYGSHFTGEIPPHSLSLKIDAAMAFGSGEHATTRGCLEALEHLKEGCGDPSTAATKILAAPPSGKLAGEWQEQGAGEQRAGGYVHVPEDPSTAATKILAAPVEFTTCLDMGCGSGILALAMAKLWDKAQVTACDNDPFAVNTTAENAVLNNVHLTCVLGDGYKALAPVPTFDLITSNILADPLCQMAPLAALVLKPQGFLVLSGFYTHQVAGVLKAHEDQGFQFYKEITVGDWATLILYKP